MTDAIITADHGDETNAETAHRAIEEKTYGFWLGLISDAIIFALLFAIFVVMAQNTADESTGYSLFRLPRVFAETMLLVASSATFGFASVAIAAGQRRRAIAWLGMTFMFGLSFVATEISELYGMAVADAGPWRSGFLSAFFALVGTHGTHVGFGLVWIALLACELALRGPTPVAASRLYRLSLFWHFLIIVWINIFSFVYLPRFL